MLLPASLRRTCALLAGSLLLAGCPTASLYDMALAFPSAPPPTAIVASGNAYQVIGPADYAAGGFDLRVPLLAANERLALLVTNAGTTSSTTVALSSTATSSLVGRVDAPTVALRAVAGAGAAADGELDVREPLRRGHELARERRESYLARGEAAGASAAARAMAPLPAVQVAAAAAVNDVRNFCVYNFTTKATTSQPATLQYLSTNPVAGQPGHAQFWVTDAVWPSLRDQVLPVRPDFWTKLGDAYELNTLPALGTYFGTESDVDGNGQVIFLFANMGGSSATGFVVGYFDPTDVYYGRDSTCAASGSNGADMLYLLDPVSFATNWSAPPSSPAFASTLDIIVDEEVPGTMAHELQHNVNFNTRCLVGHACFVASRACPTEQNFNQAENTWINEGLSMVSEDVAGFGLNFSTERSRVRKYLDGYQAWSLTCWQGDAVGNYGGVHAYMRYWLDQMGAGFTTAMENVAFHGKANVEQATGMTFDAGLAQFAAASLVSNEDTFTFPAGGTNGGTIRSLGSVLSEPRFNYGRFKADGTLDPAQPAWMPWHHYIGSCTDTNGTVVSTPPRTARVNYTAFDPVSPVTASTVRGDGWGAFVTRGTGADATISFRVSGPRPTVTLVRYSGALPDASFSGCP
jgi:hypothetical protein